MNFLQLSASQPKSKTRKNHKRKYFIRACLFCIMVLAGLFIVLHNISSDSLQEQSSASEKESFAQRTENGIPRKLPLEHLPEAELIRSGMKDQKLAVYPENRPEDFLALELEDQEIHLNTLMETPFEILPDRVVMNLIVETGRIQSQVERKFGESCLLAGEEDEELLKWKAENKIQGPVRKMAARYCGEGDIRDISNWEFASSALSDPGISFTAAAARQENVRLPSKAELLAKMEPLQIQLVYAPGDARESRIFTMDVLEDSVFDAISPTRFSVNLKPYLETIQNETGLQLVAAAESDPSFPSVSAGEYAWENGQLNITQDPILVTETDGFVSCDGTGPISIINSQTGEEILTLYSVPLLEERKLVLENGEIKETAWATLNMEDVLERACYQTGVQYALAYPHSIYRFPITAQVIDGLLQWSLDRGTIYIYV